MRGRVLDCWTDPVCQAWSKAIGLKEIISVEHRSCAGELSTLTVTIPVTEEMLAKYRESFAAWEFKRNAEDEYCGAG